MRRIKRECLAFGRVRDMKMDERGPRAIVCTARLVVGRATAEIGGSHQQTAKAAGSRDHPKGEQDPSLSGGPPRSDEPGQHPHRGQYQPESTDRKSTRL